MFNLITWHYVENSSAITEGFQLITTGKFFLVQDMNEDSFYTNCVSVHAFTETEPKEFLKALADWFDNKNLCDTVTVHYGPEVKEFIDQICAANALMYLTHD